MKMKGSKIPANKSMFSFSDSSLKELVANASKRKDL
jgi:hypothetical protein